MLGHFCGLHIGAGEGCLVTRVDSAFCTHGGGSHCPVASDYRFTQVHWDFVLLGQFSLSKVLMVISEHSYNDYNEVTLHSGPFWKGYRGPLYILYPLIRLGIALFYNFIETGLQYTKKTQEWACKLHTLHASIFKLLFCNSTQLTFPVYKWWPCTHRTGEIKPNFNPLGFPFYPWDYFFLN